MYFKLQKLCPDDVSFGKKNSMTSINLINKLKYKKNYTGNPGKSFTKKDFFKFIKRGGKL